jgi:ABC-type lipoprotein export system ATPase subunit/bifunctional DNA-binding transcriptional regulator/antitoxin component of YhaV-PrlF toxin-antitoxin module
MNQLAVDTYRRKTVGFVWQHGARNLIPYLTARENVRLPLTLSGEVGRETIERPEELLQLVGLGDRMHHRLEELSGGEQQRVAIAIALSNKPRLLLADEPTGELDTATAKTIYDLLRDLNRELGLTIVIVSHDTGIAKHVDRVVAVRDGKLASETVRVKKGDDASQEEHHFEELLVLDAAGRLALPHEYLEKFNIRRRVVLEITDEGILIRPPASGHHGNEHLHSAATASESDSDEDIEGTEKAQSNLLGRVKVWFANVKDKFKRQNSPQLQELVASGEKDQENENMQGGQQP